MRLWLNSSAAKDSGKQTHGLNSHEGGSLHICSAEEAVLLAAVQPKASETLKGLCARFHLGGRFIHQVLLQTAQVRPFGRQLRQHCVPGLLRGMCILNEGEQPAIRGSPCRLRVSQLLHEVPQVLLYGLLTIAIGALLEDALALSHLVKVRRCSCTTARDYKLQGRNVHLHGSWRQPEWPPPQTTSNACPSGRPPIPHEYADLD